MQRDAALSLHYRASIHNCHNRTQVSDAQSSVHLCGMNNYTCDFHSACLVFVFLIPPLLFHVEFQWEETVGISYFLLHILFWRMRMRNGRNSNNMESWKSYFPVCLTAISLTAHTFECLCLFVAVYVCMLFSRSNASPQSKWRPSP